MLFFHLYPSQSSRPPDKIAKLKIIIVIKHPKHMFKLILCKRSPLTCMITNSLAPDEMPQTGSALLALFDDFDM